MSSAEVAAAERRQDQRVGGLHLVMLGRVDPRGGLEEFVLGRTVDLSPRGARVRLPSPLPSVGTTLCVRLVLEGRWINLLGRAVHVETEQGELGIEFVQIMPASLEALQAYFAERQA